VDTSKFRPPDLEVGGNNRLGTIGGVSGKYRYTREVDGKRPSRTQNLSLAIPAARAGDAISADIGSYRNPLARLCYSTRSRPSQAEIRRRRRLNPCRRGLRQRLFNPRESGF
jgi:hypothetical protein